MSVEELRGQVEELISRPPPRAAEFPRLRESGELPVGLLSWGALHHPDPSTRRGCLDYLDHLGGADSATVLVEALDDPVPRVRRHAIHALSCQRCKEEPLCVDLTAPLGHVVANDVNPKVRFEALRALVWQLDGEAGAAAIDDVVSRGDLELLREALRARPRAVPGLIRARAAEALAGL